MFRTLIPFLLLLACFAPDAAEAQELLANRSFETPAVPANGNNFYTAIPSWTSINVSPAQPQPINVIKAWSGYSGNPTVTPSGGGAQYLDINSATGTIRQTVSVPSNGMIDVSGWFSVRDFAQALTGTTLRVLNSSGTVVATTSVSFAASDPIGLWKKASLANVPVTAGSYIFEATIPDFANFDLASLVFKPGLTVSKTSTPFSDPVNGTTNPKLIAGGVADYMISFATPSTYTVTSNSVVVIDATPARTDFVVTNIGAAGSGPASFAAGSSGLTYSFVSLGSTTDDIDFSNSGGASWSYVPVANANGVDPAVTHVRLRPKGAMAASSTGIFRLRYRIR